MIITRDITRPEKSNNIGTDTLVAESAIDIAAIRVQGDAMAPVYCAGDVVLYRRPSEDLALQSGDDVLVLLPGPAGSLQLLLRRLARWDDENLELYALNLCCPPIRERSRNAVLCGKVVGRLARTALGEKGPPWA
jgi:phage repressor protein C with HTH and peptisase S24 domain